MDALRFLLLGFPEAGPWFEPSLAGEVEAAGGRTPRRCCGIEVNGKHFADRRARVSAGVERFHAAQHDQAATSLGDEALEQTELVAIKKGGFDVVEDDGVKGEKLDGGFGESTEEFVGVPGFQADEDGLVEALRLLLLLESAVERVAALALAAAVFELRLAAGNADQADHADVQIVFEGALEILVLVVWAPAEIEHAVRAGIAVRRDHAAVVLEGGFLDLRGIFHGHLDLKKRVAGFLGSHLEPGLPRFVIGGNALAFLLEDFTAVFTDGGDDGFSRQPKGGDGGIDDDRRVLEQGGLRGDQRNR